jgi:hypothetical protein
MTLPGPFLACRLLQAIFVVHDGGLRGMISRERLLDSLRSKDGVE